MKLIWEFILQNEAFLFQFLFFNRFRTTVLTKIKWKLVLMIVFKNSIETKPPSFMNSLHKWQNVHTHDLFKGMTLHKKWSFPLRISSVNVTNTAVSCGFGHIYWRNSQWKTSFFVQCDVKKSLAFLTIQLPQ